jgi:hypothetical protein
MPPKKLTERDRRAAISVTVSPAALEILDGFVAMGHAENRSRAVDQAVLEWFELTRADDKRR